jgi:DNA-directed RNA polymerase specialized sigma24 family protein
LHDNIQGKHQSSLMFDIINELESDEERDLIIDKYMNLTIQEMAQKREYSRETVRKKLKNIYAKIRESYN